MLALALDGDGTADDLELLERPKRNDRPVPPLVVGDRPSSLVGDMTLTLRLEEDLSGVLRRLRPSVLVDLDRGDLPSDVVVYVCGADDEVGMKDLGWALPRSISSAIMIVILFDGVPIILVMYTCDFYSRTGVRLQTDGLAARSSILSLIKTSFQPNGCVLPLYQVYPSIKLQ